MFLSLKRVVKKKYIKLCLLASSLVGLMVSSSFSFAKYRDENYGNGNAGAARFSINVTNDTKFIYLPDNLDGYESNYYAFLASFCVDSSECEVKTKSNIYLKLCDEYSTNYDNPYPLDRKQTYFMLPATASNHPYTITGDVNSENHTLVKEDVASLLTNSKVTNFSLNTFYYGYSKDGSNYNWNNSFSITVNNTEVIIKNIISNAGSKIYINLIYFTYIGITSSGQGNGGNITYSASFENSIILSKIELEQVV
jgi:hypothetical protein